MKLYKVQNFFSTTLKEPLNKDSKFLVLDNIPTVLGGYFKVGDSTIIGFEEGLRITFKSRDDISFPKGTTVVMTVTAEFLNDIIDEIKLIKSHLCL